MRSVIRTKAVGLLALLPLIASPALAVNLLTNPSFAGSLTGWTAPPSTTYDAANDATGIPGSGSARTAFTTPVSATTTVISECITGRAGTYTIGGEVLIPSGQPVGGSGLVAVTFFSGINCASGALSGDNVSTATTGSFVMLSKSVVAPPGTVSIRFSGQNNATAAGTHVVNFDDFVLDDGASAPVPALGTFGLLGVFVALTGIALFALRPRT